MSNSNETKEVKGDTVSTPAKPDTPALKIADAPDFTRPTGKPDETVPGGAYIVGDRVLDANGNEREDCIVDDGRIVKV